MGSGQTAIAAIKTGRHYVGYEINEEYVKSSQRRIREFLVGFRSPTLIDYLEQEKGEKGRSA